MYCDFFSDDGFFLCCILVGFGCLRGEGLLYGCMWCCFCPGGFDLGVFVGRVGMWSCFGFLLFVGGCLCYRQFCLIFLIFHILFLLCFGVYDIFFWLVWWGHLLLGGYYCPRRI